MAEDGSQHDEPRPADGEQRYLDLAQAAVGSVWHGRSGFGALQKREQTLRDSVRLASSSGLFSMRSRNAEWPWMALVDPDFFHFASRRGLGVHHRTFFELALGRPSNYEPSSFWALFWAMAKAEHEFRRRYIPFWSNEERLTGHFVSQMMERVEEFASPWRSLATAGAGDVHCRIWYADTATARRESITGADLGLVVHGKIPGRSDYFKVVRFQAKKVGSKGKAMIDLDQVERLIETDYLGYYLFYHPLDPNNWCPAPTVRSATQFKHQLDEAKKKQGEEPKGKPGSQSSQTIFGKRVGEPDSYGKTSADVRDGGWDFATFVTFGVADPAAEHGVLCDDPREAARTLMSCARPEPSRVMVMTLGQGGTVVDWQNLLKEHLAVPRQDLQDVGQDDEE
ncbi:MAG: hypothetical protein AMXMBFR58_36570 [Phycisphaerae bacterium]